MDDKDLFFFEGTRITPFVGIVRFEHVIPSLRQQRHARQWGELRVQELLLTIRSNFTGTAHAKLFTGWVPSPKRKELEEAIRETTGG
ncbi:MAG: hypothetical protein MUO76_04115, partial [Anaerolineaceae bacterium]|nr:hypothetical protein [Anaerolineaceae bacterium]